VSRGWKLGIGIPMLLIGLVLAASMGLVLSFFGPGGRLRSPELRASSDGVAIVADDIKLDGFPDARETFTQLQATVEVDLTSVEGDLFIGVAPAAEARSYLEGAPIAIVTELVPFGLRTRDVPGDGGVGAPGSRDIWVASSEGGRPLSWTLLPGDWWLVVMNADGSAGVDVTGTASIHAPVLGTVVLVLLIVGLGLLAGGLGFVISGTRATPRAKRGAPPPPPPPAAGLGGGVTPPPRPDAFG